MSILNCVEHDFMRLVRDLDGVSSRRELIAFSADVGLAEESR